MRFHLIASPHLKRIKTLPAKSAMEIRAKKYSGFFFQNSRKCIYNLTGSNCSKET